MIYFKDNPDLNVKTVITSTGEKEYRRNCKRIKNEYYVINKDCFEVDGKWYRKDSGLIIMDYEKGTWELASRARNLFQGVVGYENDQILLGYFTPNPYNNCKVQSKNYGLIDAINHQILADNGFIEELATGVWRHKSELAPNGIRNCGLIANRINYNHKGYNIEDNEVEFEEKKRLFEKYDMELSKDVRKYAKFLNDTTFGIELECSQGFLPEHIQNRTGVIICRDGSLDGGPEFTTIPLQGAKGLQNINTLSNELRRRTNIDIRCALHLHLGNIPTSRLFLVSLYTLCYKIQDEVFQMFPRYKVQWEGVKKKNYNQKLEKRFNNNLKDGTREGFEEYINDSYSRIFTFLTEGVTPSVDFNRKNKRHPQKQKWDRHNRYFWVNLMNTLFSDRNTIEFRLHTPTTNSQKIINWLFICNAIVRYALIHPKEIINSNNKIQFNDVLDYYGKTFNNDRARFLSEYLKDYVKQRKSKFQADMKKGDIISEWDINEDKDYEFKYGNVTHLF